MHRSAGIEPLSAAVLDPLLEISVSRDHAAVRIHATTTFRVIVSIFTEVKTGRRDTFVARGSLVTGLCIFPQYR
jgi:hypothetical protein